MSSELIAQQRIFRPAQVFAKRIVRPLPKPPAPIVKPLREPEQRPLEGAEFAVIRYLGLHCGAGGQVVLPSRLREPAAAAVKLGLATLWFRWEPRAGLTVPFYGLTPRGQQLAAALLRPRSKPSRPKPAALNTGEKHVPPR